METPGPFRDTGTICRRWNQESCKTSVLFGIYLNKSLTGLEPCQVFRGHIFEHADKHKLVIKVEPSALGVGSWRFKSAQMNSQRLWRVRV
jgi:hypothetical protein